MDILIAGASVRAAAWSARRAGLRPHGIDLFADRDLLSCGPAQRILSSSYPHDLIPLSADAPPGPFLYTGALENNPELIDAIARTRPLWGNGGETLRAARDPVRVAAILQRAGSPGPQVRLEPAGLPRDGTWLVKPLDSAGGLGIAVLGHDAEPPERPSYYQERIAGPSLSTIYLGKAGKASLVGVTRQSTGRPGAEFVYAGSLGPLRMARDVAGRLKNLGQVLARRLGLAGIFGVDFILRDRHPWPVEINPRYTAAVEVLELALRRPLLAEHRRAFERDAPRVSADRSRERRYVGKRIVYAPVACRFAELVACDRDDDLFAVPALADIPKPGEIFEAGDPVVTVFASGATAEACRAELRRQVRIWERRLRDV